MWVVDQIAEDIAAGCPREEIAVLVRASHALNFVEQALNQKGIRYTLSGGKKFQDRAEIKDISAYLRLIANAHDRMAFERAIAAPKRNVGAGLLDDIDRSEEHTSELQSLMRISYAVFCLKKKTQYTHISKNT